MVTPRENCPPTPSAAPAPTDRFEVSFGEPHNGWIDVKFDWSAGEFEFGASNVFSPFDQMKTWLEEVALGQDSCLSVNPEGGLIYFVVEKANDGQVRFMIWRNVFGYQIEGELQVRWREPWIQDRPDVADSIANLVCDLTMTREQLVAGFYNGLMARWEQPDMRTFWESWYLDSIEELDETQAETGYPWRYAMTSEIIEAFLNKPVRPH